MTIFFSFWNKRVYNMDVLNVVKTPSFGPFIYNKIEMSKKGTFCQMPAACQSWNFFSVRHPVQFSNSTFKQLYSILSFNFFFNLLSIYFIVIYINLPFSILAVLWSIWVLACVTFWKQNNSFFTFCIEYFWKFIF